MPALVRGCLQSWKRLNPRHTVVVLTMDTVNDYVDGWPTLARDAIVNTEGGNPQPGGAFESVQKLSNWVRLTVLQRFGGVWVDASSFCVSPLEQWVDRDPRKLTLWTQRSNPNILENWAIASPSPHHPIIVAWRLQVKQCHMMGRDEYIEAAFAARPCLKEKKRNPHPNSTLTPFSPDPRSCGEHLSV